MKRMLTSKLIAKIKALFTSLWTDDNGNVEIGKNLVVDGYMKQNSWEFDKNLSNLFPSQSGVHIEYARARESNGKLSIVVYVKTDSTASTYNNSATIEIPENVYNKLYPSVGSMLDIKPYTSVPTFETASGSLGASITGVYYLRIFKAQANKITLSLHLEGTPSSGYVVLNRFEFNFILS